ncbi:hypothetical protein CCP3SC1_90008 [Gammaproteobacteria bacterium]
MDEIDACVTRSCRTQEIGIDKGYTKVFTDSDGQRHGEGFGKLLSSESDHLKKVFAARQTLEAITIKCETSGKTAKAARIRNNNLRCEKLAAHRR